MIRRLPSGAFFNKLLGAQIPTRGAVFRLRPRNYPIFRTDEPLSTYLECASIHAERRLPQLQAPGQNVVDPKKSSPAVPATLVLSIQHKDPALTFTETGNTILYGDVEPTISAGVKIDQ